ncbi:MAG: TAXI family TRAP transporter solute-binding subunit [Planctomycetes bacterium]|nr:TAXI family TRAP transporter solute-binding subunit [Planctomycetota bacterium]
MSGKSTTHGASRPWVLVLVLTLAGFALALSFVKPAPPERLVLAGGPAGGAYHRFAEAFASRLAGDGITVEVLETKGSVDNVARLAAGDVDLGYVQGGTVRDDQRPVLAGVAALYPEPVLVFVRRELPAVRTADLGGLRVSLGEPGSGTRAVAQALLGECGLGTSDVIDASRPTAELLDGFEAGALDAAFVVVDPTTEVVRELLARAEDSLRLLDEDRATAFRRHLPYLREVELSEGLVDPARDLPSRPARLLAPTAMLVSRAELHPALVPLCIEAARAVHGDGGLLADPGDFPSPVGLDVPLSKAAAKYFRDGPNVLYRTLPFPVAAVVDRLWILLLPLVTLLFPLLKIVPPVFRWRVRSRFFRWYAELREIEDGLRSDDEAESVPARERLARLEDDLVWASVPASYTDALFHLREHAAYVRAHADD